ncbi:hypothetical protein CBL_01730 [Carabus blaptoides fortunei]
MSVSYIVLLVNVFLVMPQVFVDCMCTTRDLTSFIPGSPCQNSYLPYPYNYPVIGGLPGSSLSGLPGGSLAGYPSGSFGGLSGGYPTGSLGALPGVSLGGYPGGSFGGSLGGIGQNYPIISQPYPVQFQQPISTSLPMPVSSSLPMQYSMQYPHMQTPYASTGNGIVGGIGMPIGNTVPY